MSCSTHCFLSLYFPWSFKPIKESFCNRHVGFLSLYFRWSFNKPIKESLCNSHVGWRPFGVLGILSWYPLTLDIETHLKIGCPRMNQKQRTSLVVPAMVASVTWPKESLICSWLQCIIKPLVFWSLASARWILMVIHHTAIWDSHIYSVDAIYHSSAYDLTPETALR